MTTLACVLHIKYWNCFKGDVEETSQRQGGAHVGFFERIATILNWTDQAALRPRQTSVRQLLLENFNGLSAAAAPFADGFRSMTHSHSEHRFPAPSSLKKGCCKPGFGVCDSLTDTDPALGTTDWRVTFFSFKYRSVQFSSAQDGIYALGKAHMRSTPSLRNFPNVAFKAVPMFVWLKMSLSRPFKEDRLNRFSLVSD